MEIKDTFLTIASVAEGLYKEKGSKFIAFAYPVNNEEEVKKLVQHLKKEHHSARHHCYAYRLGNEGEHYRANDDGEPSGTAGKPILGQLISHNLTNILVVVVRYFGGTLLGVSGLINAYKNSAIEAINQAEIIEKIIENFYQLEFGYPLQNSVMKVIKDHNLEIIKTAYDMNCKIEIAVRLNNEKLVTGLLIKIDGVTIVKREK